MRIRRIVGFGIVSLIIAACAYGLVTGFIDLIKDPSFRWLIQMILVMGGSFILVVLFFSFLSWCFKE